MIKSVEQERCCGNCRFYNEDGRDCRRFPPQVWGDPQSEFSSSYCCNFPEVSKDDWCGEFQSEQVGWRIPEGFVLLDPHAKKEGNEHA